MALPRVKFLVLRIALAALAGIALAMVLLPPAPQAQTARAREVQIADDLKRVEAARDAVLKRLKDLERRGAVAQREADAIDADLIAAAADSQVREEEAGEAELRLVQLEAEAADARTKMKANAGAEEDLLAALISLSTRRPPALAASPNDAGAAIRAAMLMGDATPALTARASALRDQILRLNAAMDGVRRERAELTAANTALRARRQEIEALAAEKRLVHASLASEASELRAESQRLAGEAETLRDLLDKLAKSKAATTAKPGKTPAAKPPGKSTASATRPAPKASGPISKAEAAGARLTPAVGKILYRFGQTVDGARHPGLTFTTRAGAQVVAPRDARVQYAGVFRSYGEMLILDVGQDYLVVVSGLDALYPEAGQWVLAGEPIGRMADGKSPELYLEVRKAGQPVDPEGWLAKGR